MRKFMCLHASDPIGSAISQPGPVGEAVGRGVEGQPAYGLRAAGALVTIHMKQPHLASGRSLTLTDTQTAHTVRALWSLCVTRSQQV